MPTPEHRQSPIETPNFSQETDPALELVERLRLREQYLAQVKVLDRSGLLESFPATDDHPLPELGIIGVDGEQYSLPSYEDILERLKDPEARAMIEKKYEQGFTKMLLVPFALPLQKIIQKYKQTLLEIDARPNGLKATDGTRLELNREDPIYIWDKLTQCDNPATPEDQQLEYQVQNYDGQTKEARGGKYKSELLNSNPQNAWQVLLIEDNPDLPAEGRGETISGRKQIEANKTPKEYLKLLQTQEQYQNEQGLTPEAALIDWLASLQETQTVRDNYQGSGKINWLVGSRLSGLVPGFYWYRDDRQPNLFRTGPDNRSSRFGFRPAVSV